MKEDKRPTLIEADALTITPKTRRAVWIHDTEKFEAAMKALQCSVEEFIKHLAKFTVEWIIQAHKTYRLHHSRLPGSTRTARLRKKRLNRVLEWYGKQNNQLSASPSTDGR